MNGRRGRPSRPVIWAVLAVGLTVALGALAYGAVPGRVRVHWTLGTGPYVGPETLPRALGSSVLPTVSPLVLAGPWALRTAVGPGSDPRARRYWTWRRWSCAVACSPGRRSSSSRTWRRSRHPPGSV